MAYRQRAGAVGAGIVATLVIFVSSAAGLPAYAWIAFMLAVLATLIGLVVVKAKVPFFYPAAGTQSHPSEVRHPMHLPVHAQAALPEGDPAFLTVGHSSSPYSRPSTNLAGGTQPHPDDIRYASMPSETTEQEHQSEIASEDDYAGFAIGRYSRFSRPSANLIGGTQLHPDDVRWSQWHAETPGQKTQVTSGSGDEPESLAIGRYSRFSRPSSNLVGGTQLHHEDIRRPPRSEASGQKPLPIAPQVKATQGDQEFFTIRQESSDSQSFSIPQAPDRPAKARWLGAGESITVAGVLLPAGLIYVGANDAKFRLSEPSFIDISLPVNSSPADIDTRLTSYWPSYDSLKPAARRGYLQWLAGGRCAPLADVGYVLIFFYGLERRVLVDAITDADARAEIPTIQAEVERLRALYSEYVLFRSYASMFLDYMNMGAISPRMYLHEPPTISADSYDMPIPLRVALGQMSVDKYPMNAAWAFAWTLSDSSISRRTPVVRCADLFQRLFQIAYEKRFPRGLTLLNNKARLKVIYQAASSRINTYNVSAGDIPDVIAISGTRNKLQLIVEECTTVLGPFSRYLGRNPDSHNVLEGLLHLPIFLWPEQARLELEHLQSRVGDDAILMTLGELAGRFKSTGVLPRDKVIVLARVLEELNIGMEPDVLSGSRIPKVEDNIVLFATEPDDGTLRTTSGYNTALVTLDLASAVATADGDASFDEVALLGLHIDSWSHLCSAHRKRLKAYLQVQLQQPPTLASLKKKLGPLGQDEKRAIVAFLTHLAQVNGAVTPREVKVLERVYKALQLDPQTLYGDLHVAAATSTGLSQSNNVGFHGLSSSSGTGSTIQKQGAGIVLDMNKVAQLQRETAEVSALLAKVFQDEQDDEQLATDDTPQSAAETGEHLYGLDAEHSAFLRLLISRNEWSRQELENATTDMELMLDGALEQINDMAFELFNMPISEGDDPIEINPDILSELAL